MTDNPLVALTRLGQSLWLDYIQRGMLLNGELQHLIDEDGISGVTSNPAILQKAIVESDDYTADIAKLAPRCSSAEALYEALALEDIRRAADLLHPLYDRVDARDGYVSFEVSPHLAYDTAGTVSEARRLWTVLDRPNAMIKVPATLEGLPAMTTLIAEGMNINATLIFCAERYHQVAQAFFDGLELRRNQGQAVEHIASVASFFISRIDSLVDRRLDALADQRADFFETTAGLRGRIAGAAARIAYGKFKQLYDTPRWQALANAGARPQRLLWASTSTKDAAYSDVKYVEDLIGSQTVNTLPLKTVSAYRDHGSPSLRLDNGLTEADELIGRLGGLGIKYADLAMQLESEGVNKFIDAYEKLLEAISQSREVTQV